MLGHTMFPIWRRHWLAISVCAVAITLCVPANALAQEFPLFVADSAGMGVYSLDAAGVLTPRGFVSGSLNSVRKDKNGNLYTCDEQSSIVSKIDSAGSVTAYATGFSGCFGLLFGPDGVLYVSNIGAGRIDAIAPGGGSTATLATALQSPMHMTFDTDGSILVAEFSAGRVSRIDGTGDVSTVVGGLDHPVGVGVGPDDNIYVSEFFSGQLVRVDRTGSVSLLADRGGNGPAGLAFHRDGRLFVAEGLAGQIVSADIGTGVVSVFRSGLDVPLDLSFDQSSINQPPVADAGTPQTVHSGALVTLNGTGSDPDGDQITYHWVQLSGPPVALASGDTAAPSFTAPSLSGAADLVFQLTVSDGVLSGMDTVTVTVSNDQPRCDLAQASPSSLWPPDHRMVLVNIMGVTDLNNDALALTVTGVTQDEPTSGLGDGDSAPDAVIHGSAALIRAERSATGDGRVYRINFSADDGRGGTCSGWVAVVVPRSAKPGQGAVDSGQLYNSTAP